MNLFGGPAADRGAAMQEHFHERIIRVSWILMPGYFAVPTVIGSAIRCRSGNSTWTFSALGLETGEAVGDLQKLFAHGRQMVQALLQAGNRPGCWSRFRCAGMWRTSRTA